MPVTQVLVVDDFLPWLRLVRVMLESRKDLNIIAEAVDGLEAVQKAQQLQPDLIVLDISLPTLNGIEAARRIRELSPNSRILFVSNETSSEVVEEAIRLGARGYLWKLDAASELSLAVDAILRGEWFVGSRLRHDVMTGADDENAAEGLRSTEPPALLLRKAETRRVHEVASYKDDASFVDDLTRFIETALKKGNSAIAIATEAHRNSILQRLQARNRNVAAAIQEGRYISLDASDSLSAFMVNDWPDATRLFHWADGLFKEAARSATGAHPRIAICGECAPILWALGKADAAIRLERLWDAIARNHAIDILCGYSFASLRRSEDSQVFERIRAEHSAAYSFER
jgi:DNA-binding NarL/FixJ family response regulator